MTARTSSRECIRAVDGVTETSDAAQSARNHRTTIQGAEQSLCDARRRRSFKAGQSEPQELSTSLDSNVLWGGTKDTAYLQSYNTDGLRPSPHIAPDTTQQLKNRHPYSSSFTRSRNSFPGLKCGTNLPSKHTD
jgi:hypothetical protein